MDEYNPYREYGYHTRNEYLADLAAEYNVPIGLMHNVADMYGQDEDFDGLVTFVQDYDLMNMHH